MVRLAVVGATGAVGREVSAILEHSAMKIRNIRFFASAASAAKKATVRFRGIAMPVEDLAEAEFRDFDAAIFSVGSKASRIFAPKARDAGCIVIDNSSAYRMSDDVPLIVPEINALAINSHSGIIANPNCTTAITLMGLFPLHRAFGVTCISATSYQAASGAGAAGLSELNSQINARVGDMSVSDGVWQQRMFSDIFPAPIAMNVIPQVGSFLENGSTDEEMKILNEGRKILGHPDLRATTTCVRVPVERVHCVDVLALFERTPDLDSALTALRAMPGLDTLEGTAYATPLQYSGKNNCAIGRVRVDEAFPNALRFWIAGDQLLKGAALNAVQITERVVH